MDNSVLSDWLHSLCDEMDDAIRLATRGTPPDYRIAFDALATIAKRLRPIVAEWDLARARVLTSREFEAFVRGRTRGGR